jgi:SdrD B-like domain/Prealbumin-like fold domain
MKFHNKLSSSITAVLFLAGANLSFAQVPTELYYLPFPENELLADFSTISTAVATDPLTQIVTITVGADNSVVYYDHWEDGYEIDITNPKQSTTLIFGDGNPANGAPVGNSSDVLVSGNVFNLRGVIKTATLASVIDVDARDKIASFKPITVTKLAFPTGTNTLLGSCVEVFKASLWGKEYRVPLGENMPTSAGATPLTFDNEAFELTSISILAGPGGATVNIDSDNNGTFEETVAIAEGKTLYRRNINVGARITADQPINVVMFTGDVGSTYESRDTSLLPIERYGNEYFAPTSTVTTKVLDAVTTLDGIGTSVFLYNPGTSAITVSYDVLNTNPNPDIYVTNTVSVPAGGNARVTLVADNNTTNQGAYRFYTASPTSKFYAFLAVNANDPLTTGNQAYDSGYGLMPRDTLTTQLLVGLGIGRDPFSSTALTENGNPVWLTTVGNGIVPETVYVDYGGDNSGALVDPNGNRYDISYSLRELEQQRIFEADLDQSGMLIYTLNPNVRLAGGWAQDPSVASAAQPGLDVAALIPPMPVGSAGKKSRLVVDADGDGFISPGDTLEYDIVIANDNRAGLAGPFLVVDNLPANVVYAPTTTRYRFSVADGNYETWTQVSDDPTGTLFPLDVAGVAIPGNLGSRREIQVNFRVQVKPFDALIGEGITNSGTVKLGTFEPPLPLFWSDPIYGSIADTIWNDLDADGVKDSGEVGFAGVPVYVDLNYNGSKDLGEPSDVTDAAGLYKITGLQAGNYTVRVEYLAISASNPGFGPTFDLDGTSTAHVAEVTLAAGQARTDVDFGYRTGASLGDRVWLDQDGDGIQDTGEPGLSDVRVYVDANGNNVYDTGEQAVFTSTDGDYYIGNLPAGTYSVRVDTTTLPIGSIPTYDLSLPLDNEAVVTLTAGQHNPNLDFGYRGTFSIGDRVWNDVNGDGIQGAGEANLPNVLVYIDSNGNGVLDPEEPNQLTNSTGNYLFTNLTNGDYSVRVDPATLPANLSPTFDLTTASLDNAATVTINGANRLDVDFGYSNSGSIGDFVWNDRNANGVIDPGEPPIEGVLVFIDANGNGVYDANTELFDITDANGFYKIENLSAGSYSVRTDISTIPQGSTQTYDLNGIGTPNQATRVLTAGEDATNVDFGYRATASFGDTVWVDNNANGIFDAGEVPLGGVRVYSDSNGDGNYDPATEPSAITNALGQYSIGNLTAGVYTARVDVSTLPPNYVQTFDAAGVLDHSATFQLSAAQTLNDVDFGYAQPATIGNFVFSDLNANGQQDLGEPGIQGVSVSLIRASDGAVLESVLTDPNGAYLFDSHPGGTYVVEFGTVPGFTKTQANSGSDVTDSDADTLTGRTSPVVVPSGTSNLTLDAGYLAAGAIAGNVREDTNGDGTGDLAIPNATIRLVTATGADIDSNPFVAGVQPTLTATDSNGNYVFPSVPAGTYRVIQTQPSSYTSISDVDGANDNVIGLTTPITVTPLNTAGGNNFVEEHQMAIGNAVYIDTNGNGLRDLTETVVPPSTVVELLYDSDKNGVIDGPELTTFATTTTDAAGLYSFTGLTAGNYQVRIPTPPSGFILSSPTTATADNGINNDDNGIQDLAGGATLSPIISLQPTTEPAGFIDGSDSYDDSTVDFGFVNPGAVSGNVLVDSNNDSTGDAVFPVAVPVTLTLFTDPNGDGEPSDGVPVENPNLSGSQAYTVVANATTGAYIFTNVAPGKYVIIQTQPTDYANVSEVDATLPTDDSQLNPVRDNRIPVTILAGETDDGNNFVDELTVGLGDRLFVDNNGDGVWQSASETTIVPETVIELLYDANNDGAISGAELTTPWATTTTGLTGTYSFPAIGPGRYQVRIPSPPVGFTLSSPAGVTDSADNQQDGDDNGTQATAGAPVTSPLIVLARGGEPAAAVDGTDNNVDSTIDFGFQATATASGIVRTDDNNDGTADSPLAGVTLTLYVDTNNDGIRQPTEVAVDNPNIAGVQGYTVVTDTSGNYSFVGLPAGNYVIVQTQPVSFLTVSEGDGSLPGDDIVTDPANNDGIPVTLVSGETDSENNFLEERSLSIGNSIFIDANANGIFDAGELLNAATVTVQLFFDTNNNGVIDGSETTALTTVAATGSYSFTGLQPGNYVVGILAPPANASISSPNTDTADNSQDGDDNGSQTVTGGSITSPVISLLPGQEPIALIDGTDEFTDSTIDFGLVSPASIAGNVGSDTDNNGTSNVGLGGVTLTLFTDPNGDGDPSDGVPVINPNLPGSLNYTVTTSTVAATLGNYIFTGLLPGRYVVVQTQPANFFTLSDGDVSVPADDAVNVSLTDNRIPVSLTVGEVDSGNNFIEEGQVAIGNTLFVDVNNDGIRQVTETAIVPNTVVELLFDANNDGDFLDAGETTPLATTNTGSTGIYSFTGLQPGRYQVRIPAPPVGFELSSTLPAAPVDATADNNDSGIQLNTGGVVTSPPIVLLPGSESDGVTATSNTDNTVDFGFVAPATASGIVQTDTNNDGTPDGVLPGVTLSIFADANGDGIADLATPLDNPNIAGTQNYVVTTDAAGAYSFTGLPPGRYVIVETQPTTHLTVSDGDATTPGDDLPVNVITDNRIPVTLTSGEVDDGNNFVEEKTMAIGNVLFIDTNGNGVRDASETAAPPSTTVQLIFDANNNGAIDGTEGTAGFFTTTSNATTGAYAFTGLQPGQYIVRINTPPLGFGISSPVTGTSDNNVDNDDNGIQAIAGSVVLSPPIVLLPGSEPAAAVDGTDTDTNSTIDFGFIAPASISGNVQQDTNNDSLSNGGLAGVTLGLFTDPNGDGDPSDGVAVINPNVTGGVAYTVTSAVTTGAYSFTNLPPGNYVVVQTQPTGFLTVNDGDTTVPADDPQVNVLTDNRIPVRLTAGEVDTGNNFLEEPTMTLGNELFADTNNDGLKAAGEVGALPATLIELLFDANNDGDFTDTGESIPVATTTSIVGGGTAALPNSYSFAGLAPGNYQVRIPVPPVGFANSSTTAAAPTDATANSSDSGIQSSVGGAVTSPLILLLPGLENNGVTSTSNVDVTVDFGFVASATASGLVQVDLTNDATADDVLSGVTLAIYNDVNNNGVFDGGDTAVDASPGTAGLQPYTVATGPTGAYAFTGLAPGNYVIFETQPSGYVNINDGDVIADLVTSPADAANVTTDDSISVRLSAGETDSGNNFLERQPPSISGFVREDTDNDGVGDLPISGVVLTLTDSLGNPILGPGGLQIQVTTGPNGAYIFPNLAPGIYGVLQTQPPGLLDVSDVDGGNPNQIVPITVALLPVTNQNFVEEQPGTISGTVLADTDSDNVGDLPIGGVFIALFTDPNGDGNPADGVAIGTPIQTSASGSYAFTGVAPGSYVVVQTQPAIYGTISDGDSTIPADDLADSSVFDNRIPVNITSGETDTGNDFTEVLFGSISGFVRADTDNNNTGDAPIGGVQLVLVDSSGNVYDSDPLQTGVQSITATTDPVTGAYTFANVPPGVYGVSEAQPPGYNSISDTDGGDPNLILPITVTAGNNNGGNDFVEEQTATISGSVLADADNNGSGDSGIKDVVLTLLDSAGQPVDGDPNEAGVQLVTAITALDGSYSFTGVSPGVYFVTEAQPATYLTVTDIDTTTPADDAVNASITDNLIPVAVNAGEVDNGNDFIEELTGSISGSVLVDINNDNTGDDPIEAVTLTLLNPDGSVYDSDPSTPAIDPITATTLPDGSYTFVNVPPGTYGVGQAQPPGVISVGDLDGGNPNVISTITVTAGLPSTGNNFIEEVPGTITGSVFVDTNNDGTGDSPIGAVVLRLLNPDSTVFDSDPVASGIQELTATTDLATGIYSFTNVPPGSYLVSETQPTGVVTVSDGDTTDPADDATNTSLFDNRIPVTVATGETDSGNDFLEAAAGSISGSVLADTNNDDLGDTPIPGGVTLTLVDSLGIPVDGDPVTPGVQPITTTTDGSGNYVFVDVPVGTYGVIEAQPIGFLSVSDLDGGNLDEIRPITVVANTDTPGNNFVEEQPSTISGLVRVDTDGNGSPDAPLPDISLTLFSDPNGDGDPADGEAIGLPVSTLANGSYSFPGIAPGAYVVVQTQPTNYFTVSDSDGSADSSGSPADASNISPTDNLIPVNVRAGELDSQNNFVESLTKPNTFAAWQVQNPLGGENGLTQNPDGDGFTNLVEYALCGNPSTGLKVAPNGSPNSGFQIRPSLTTPDQIDASFIRPAGIADVTYTLQYSSDGQTWVTTTAIAPVIVDNGNGSETVTYPNIESLGASGFVRLEISSSATGTLVKNVTQISGWQLHTVKPLCESFAYPFLKPCAFTGRVDSVTGNTLSLATSVGTGDLTTLNPAKSYYIEVTSGDAVGCRYDIASFTASTITLATDSDLYASTAPLNTTLVIPANLTADRIVIREHYTLGELFPADQAGAPVDGFVSGTSLANSGKLLFYNRNTQSLERLYLETKPTGPPIWRTLTSAVSLNDRVLGPDQGIFTHNFSGIVGTPNAPVSAFETLQYGEVRTNAVRIPLKKGYNLIPAMYPVDQNYDDRNLLSTDGATGNSVRALADQVQFWKDDSNTLTTGTPYLCYDATFYLNTATLDKWIYSVDRTLASQTLVDLFQSDRSALYYIHTADRPTYTISSPISNAVNP